MVFAGIYPVDADEYEDLRIAIEKLQLNDASLFFCAGIICCPRIRFQMRIPWPSPYGDSSGKIDREFNMDVITTVPNVSFKVMTTQGEEKMFIIPPVFRPSTYRKDRLNHLLSLSYH
jgi:GTP-binding protein LepA